MANSQILSPKVPQAKDQVFNWKGLAGCGDSLALASAIKNENRLFVIVTADNQTALRLEHELDFFFTRCSSNFAFSRLGNITL